MEHEQSIDQAEQEIRERVGDLEDQGDRLDERKEQFGRDVDEAREDFEQKKEAADVPGAQPVSERESDQLPEEGPGAVDDDEGRTAREEAKESPGGAGDEGRATGNPPQDDSGDE